MMISREDWLKTAVAFAISNNGSRTGTTNRDRGTCGHYGKFGHEEAGCFELIGYPPGWNSRSLGRGRGYRGSRGGQQGGLRGRGDGREGAYAVATSSSPAVNSNTATQPMIPGLTTDQIQ